MGRVDEDEGVDSNWTRLGVAVLVALGFLVVPSMLSSPPPIEEAELIPAALVESTLAPEAVPGTISVLGATEERREDEVPAIPTTAPASTTTIAFGDVAGLPTSGSGSFSFAGSGSAPFGVEPYLDFAVAAEDGTGIDPESLAAFVDETLSDPRSWIGDGDTGLRRVDAGGVFTLVVATPDTVDALCAPLRTNGYFSCARNGFVLLNLHRWETATEDWTGTLEEYRRYLVNHEVGHYLAGPDHPSCPGEGELAPVMMQQTKGLDGCVANGWVYPEN